VLLTSDVPKIIVTKFKFFTYDKNGNNIVHTLLFDLTRFIQKPKQFYKAHNRQKE